MSIKRTIVVTAAIAASVAMVAPTFAGAVTIAELQAQINALLAQLQALQGSTTTTAGTGACAGVSFSRNLTVGSTGSDVKCLQSLLNSNGFTVSATGAGSPGGETTYFGSKTLVAVRAFQSSKGWTPANQVGPMTRAALNALLGGTTGGTTTPVIVPTGAGLQVMLASDNPVAGTVVDGQGLAPLAKFVFVNGDSSEVKVTSVKVKRVGISADSTLTNVYLFEGAKRLTDSASVASTMINFNDSTGIFTVPAGGSKTISILADVDGSTGETVGVQVVAGTDVVSNASSVNGTFPVSGNLFTLASGTNLATIYMQDASGTTDPSTATIDPQNDYAIWYDEAIVGTRAVYLNRIAFRVGGSVNRTSDIKNFRLLIDGTQVGSAVANADANDYITFDLTSAPVKIETGTRVIKVLADIIGGSNKNVYLSLRTAADVSVTDSQLNATLLLHRVNTTTSFTALDSGTQSISSGTLTVTKLTSSPSSNVVDEANNISLAKYEFKAAGERVKIESLRVSATVSDTSVGALRNGAVYANGVQIGSTTDLETVGDTIDTTNEYTTYNFGSSLIVEPGSPVTVEVRADIYDNDGTDHMSNNDTVLVTIEGGDLNNAYGMVSMATVDVPSADVTANTLTVKTGTLTLSKYTAYTNQNAVVPLTDYKLAHFTLTAGTTEAVNINTIYVYFNYVSGNASNFYVKVGNNTTAVKSSPTSASGRSADSWAVNYSVPAGQTVDVMVYGNVNSNASGVARTGVYMTGTTASSATAVTAGTTDDETTGQTITFTSGTWASALDGGAPLNQAVVGGQTVTAAKYKLTAQNDSFTLKEVSFTVPSGADPVINSLTVKDGSTVLGTAAFNGTDFDITGLNLAVPANTSKVITVDLSLVNPSTDGTVVTTGKNLQVTMSYVKRANSQGTEATPSTSVAGNYVYAFKTIPTFTLGSIPSGQGTNLAAGSTTSLYNFSAKADPKGAAALKQLKFTVAVTDPNGTNGSLNTFKFFRGSTDITTSVTIQNIYGEDLESTTDNISGTSSTVIVTFNTEEQIPAGSSYSYTLKATPADFAGDGTNGYDSVSVTLPADSVPAAGSAGDAHTNFYTYGSANTGIQTLATDTSGTSGTAANVIWSDNSANDHDYTYNSSSADWFNGYLIENLALDSIGIVANQ